MDVAKRAGVSQQTISDLERGRLGAMALEDVARVFEALDMRLALVPNWRGGELDRLLDERHAAISGACANLLRAARWDVLSEVTFSVYGERGSIDLLAWHAETRTLLVIEIKTAIASAEELLRRHDVKVRLAPRIWRERFGISPVGVARLLVVAGSSANRARIARLSPLLNGAYPMRGLDVRRWLVAPSGSIGGLLFLDTGRTGTKKEIARSPRTERVPDTGATGTSA